GRRLDRTRKSDSRRLSPASEVFDRKKARLKLLEHLKEIAFHCPGYWFKADLIEDGVSIRMYRRREGIEEAVAGTLQSNRCLRAVDHPDFREMLIHELIRVGFSIEI